MGFKEYDKLIRECERRRKVSYNLFKTGVIESSEHHKTMSRFIVLENYIRKRAVRELG